MNDKNNIEHFYREAFDNDDAVKNEGWNNPDNAVWDRIEAEIFEEKRDRFGYLPFLLTSFLIMTLVFTVYLYSQNQDLRQTIIDNKSDAFPTLDVIQSPKMEPSVQLVDNEDDKSANIVPLIHKKDAIKNVILTQVEKREIITESKESVITPTKVTQSESKIVLPASPEIGSNSKRIDALTPLDTRIVFLSANQQIIHLNSPEIIDIQKENVQQGYKLAILPGITNAMLNSQGTQETALTELIDNEYGNAGFGLDILLTNSISKSVDLSFGIGVEQMNFSTEYDVTLPYKSEDEIASGEQGYIDFEHSLPTSFGNTDTALRLSRKRNTSAIDEAAVNLDFDTNHEFTLISAPIGLSYRLGSNTSFVTLGLDIRPSYILHGNSSIKSVVSHHSAIDAVNNVSTSSYPNINRYNLSLGFQLGYHHYTSKRGGFQLNIGMQDYLFDFYKVGDFSSSVRKMEIKVGYFYEI